MPAPLSKRKTPKRSTKSLSSPTDIDSRSILLEAAAKVGDAEVLAVLRDAKKIEEKSKKGLLADFFTEIRDLLAMVRDFAGDKYRAVPFGSIAAIVGALLYVLSPVDLIPDFIPGMGYVDDAGVIAACLKLVKPDLDRYRKRKKA
jgi:uncharacterized membrane protein YkvA (DUF1232 family)